MKMIAIEAINTPATEKLLFHSQHKPCRRKFITNDSLINAFIPYYASNNPEPVTPINPAVCDASAVPANTMALMGPMTQQQTAGGSCPVPAPTADSLTIAHKDAAGDKTKPGYGGQCKPDQHDDLAKKKTESCKKAKKTCSPGVIDLDLAEAYKSCNAARKNVADICFMGGDNDHNLEIKNNEVVIRKCTTGK